MKIRNFNKMKRINFLVWICLLISSQLTAQKSQSFIEHWFGVQPQQIIQQQAKAQVQSLSQSFHRLFACKFTTNADCQTIQHKRTIYKRHKSK